MFLLLVILLKTTQVDGLECYHCSDVRNVSDCHTLITCPTNNMCFTETRGTGDQMRFNLTCKPEQECQTMTTTTVPPSAQTGLQDTDCAQCCAKPACNTYLCSMGTQSIISTGQCRDDPAFDCQRTSSFFDICSDIHHAKAVCKDFCGLCALVDGGWADWGTWSACSVTCGNGTISRTRSCTNPSPAHGGLDCPGIHKQDSSCYVPDCPIAGGWSAWSPWNSCSVSCGVGLQRRDRSCSNPYPGRFGDHCFGDDKVYKSCFDRSCSDGAWSSWSAWGACSTTCNVGLQARTRTCSNPAPSQFGRDCRGNDEDKQLCNTQNCPVTDGAWSSWSVWGSCSATCNGGLQARTRTCSNPAPLQFGRDCRGTETDKQLCNNHNCPVTDGAWSSWSVWGSCSATCNGGLQARTRTCTNPAPSQFGRDCSGTETDKQLCNNHNCPAKQVAFSVNILNSNLIDGKTPTFQFTNVNTGSFNMSTGKFTCPVAGLYHFSFAMERNSGSTSMARCYFVLNGRHKNVCVRASTGPYEAASGSFVTHLSVNDVVSLDCSAGWQYVFTNNLCNSVFNGFLISQD